MRMSYVIVFVRDMKRSVTFYRDVLHLPLRFESPEWTEFATGGTTRQRRSLKASLLLLGHLGDEGLFRAPPRNRAGPDGH